MDFTFVYYDIINNIIIAFFVGQLVGLEKANRGQIMICEMGDFIPRNRAFCRIKYTGQLIFSCCDIVTIYDIIVIATVLSGIYRFQMHYEY